MWFFKGKSTFWGPWHIIFVNNKFKLYILWSNSCRFISKNFSYWVSSMGFSNWVSWQLPYSGEIKSINLLCFQMNFEYTINSPYIEDLEMHIKMREKRNIILKVVLIFVLTFLAYTGLLLLSQCWLYMWKYICEKKLPWECIECIKMQPPNKMIWRDKNIFMWSSISKCGFTNIQYQYHFAISL